MRLRPTIESSRNGKKIAREHQDDAGEGAGERAVDGVGAVGHQHGVAAPAAQPAARRDRRPRGAACRRSGRRSGRAARRASGTDLGRIGGRRKRKAAAGRAGAAGYLDGVSANGGMDAAEASRHRREHPPRARGHPRRALVLRGRARPRRLRARLVDLAEVGLPLYDEPKHPRLREYQHEHTRRWSAIVEEADAYVFVTPDTTTARRRALERTRLRAARVGVQAGGVRQLRRGVGRAPGGAGDEDHLLGAVARADQRGGGRAVRREAGEGRAFTRTRSR